MTKNQFNVTYPYIEGEIYFTTDKSAAKVNPNTGRYEWDFSNNRANFNLRIPDRSIKVGGLSSTEPNVQTQKFIPPRLERSNLTQPIFSPITPGHYGVVGSAGTNFGADPGSLPDPTARLIRPRLGGRNPLGKRTTQTRCMNNPSVLIRYGGLKCIRIQSLQIQRCPLNSFSSRVMAAIPRMKSLWGARMTRMRSKSHVITS